MDDRYMAFTSVGALVEGWSLVSPRAHAVNLLDSYDDAAFLSFVRKAIVAAESIYGPVSVFEHGGQHEDSETSCGTSHAHLHIVPVQFSLQQEAISFDSRLSWLKCSLKDIKSLVETSEYLYVSDAYNGEETTGDLCILEEGQSQFFRRVVANRLGIPEEWNYRTHPNLVAATAGSEALRSFSERLKAA
jgi:hypothetical protein